MQTRPLRIGDELVTTEETRDVVAPFDKSVIGRVSVGTEEHLDRAVAVARARLTAGDLPAHQRAAILDRAAELLAERADDFARTIALEAAKPITTAKGEVARGVDTLRLSAAAARTLTGELLPMDAAASGVGKTGFVKRVPSGIVAAITPFNFPLNLVLHKLGPALAAGCPVVLKPASATPMSAIDIVDMLVDDCGLPDGWINVVTCSGSTANHLVTHDDVAVISFTGSRDVGWGIREAAPRKKVGLELGNNAPAIIEPDSDWHTAVDKIRTAGFSHAGQSCISTQRLLVHADIAGDFVEALAKAVGSLVVGDPLDPDTDVSVLIDDGETERVRDWIAEAVEQGATLAVGGDLTDGGILQPTVLTDVTPDMKVCRQEIFGPVVAVQTYTDFEDALATANDTDYGLHAAVFTKDLAKALRAADVLDFGGVLINEVPTWRADLVPYGGVRDSGNTREGPLYAIRELLTEQRLVVIQP